VTYSKTKQPRDYESEKCEIGVVAGIEDEDYTASIATLVEQTRAAVYHSLGLSAPAQTTVEKVSTSHKNYLPQPEIEPGVAFPRPGRQRRPQKAEPEPEPAPAPANTSKPEPVPAPEPEPVVEPEPETVAEPEPVAEEWEETAPAPVAEITDKELTAKAAAVSRKVGAPKVRDLLNQWKAARLGEIPKDKRGEFVAELEKLA
jgi:outer membrane biosynthesis protein TonB